MYLWKTNQLAEDLKNNQVDENEFFQYVLLSSILMFLIIESYAYSEPNPVTQFSMWKSGFMFLVTIFGTYYCYKINSEGDNQKFVERLVALNVPLLIKFVIWMLLAGVVLGILNGMVFQLEEFLDYSIPVTEALASLLIYWRLYVHIKFIAH